MIPARQLKFLEILDEGRYIVSPEGKIHGRLGKELRPGDSTVTLRCHAGRYVHCRKVDLAWLHYNRRIPKNYRVIALNGDLSDCRQENLDLVARYHQSLNAIKVRLITKELRKGSEIDEIARTAHVSRRTVSELKKGLQRLMTEQEMDALACREKIRLAETKIRQHAGTTTALVFKKVKADWQDRLKTIERQITNKRLK